MPPAQVPIPDSRSPIASSTTTTNTNYLSRSAGAQQARHFLAQDQDKMCGESSACKCLEVLSKRIQMQKVEQSGS